MSGPLIYIISQTSSQGKWLGKDCDMMGSIKYSITKKVLLLLGVVVDSRYPKDNI